MDEVLLGEDGSLRERDGAEVDDVLRALDARVVLGPGYSLRSFMRMLRANPVLFRLNDFARDFAELYPSWPAEGCVPPGLSSLELFRVVEMIGHPAPPRLEIYHTLRGLLPDGGDMEIKSWQVEMLLDAPLVLGPLKHVVFGDRVAEFSFATVCNLFEFFEGVLWQLAFHGTPRECALRR
ncbi:MAG: hypothetical protein AUJ49_02485 [Desulfovibrionaceae bacterium CG1_02_65_16]|nr:MAG: hypothetical protein AUJ49_02485 [Desulfovibrionaceae bacterium CG1_02_65_16]